jgi:hypothetical protein
MLKTREIISSKWFAHYQISQEHMKVSKKGMFKKKKKESKLDGTYFLTWSQQK